MIYKIFSEEKLSQARQKTPKYWNKIFLGNKIGYISDKNIYLFKQKLFGIQPSSVLQYGCIPKSFCLNK